MNATEIIVSEKQRDRRFKVLSLFAKGIGQPCKPAHLHAYRKILPLNVACADVVSRRLSADRLSYTVHDHWRGIAMLVILRHGINLYQLGKVYAFVTEFMHKSIAVGGKAIRCHLKVLIPSGAVEFLRERPGIVKRAASEMPSQNQLRVTLEGDKGVGIAQAAFLFGVIPKSFVLSLLFHPYKRPYLITLNVCDRDALNLALKQPFGPLASKHYELQDSVTMDAGQSLSRANGIAFNEQLEAEHGFAYRQAHRVKRVVLILLESLQAGMAFITLITFAVFAVPLSFEFAVALSSRLKACN